MDYRRDILPPAIGIGASLVLHAALFWMKPEILPDWNAPRVETLVLEVLPAPTEEPTALPEKPATPPAEPPIRSPKPKAARPSVAGLDRKPREVRKEKTPLQAFAPASAPTSETDPETKSSPPPTLPAAEVESTSPPKEVKGQPLPQPASAQPPRREKQESVPPRIRSEAVTARAPIEITPPETLSLRDLMPRPQELAAHTEPVSPPDPAGGARRATLTLGDTDERYRGYLQWVEAAINSAWGDDWWEILIMMGRDATVEVFFTLTPTGKLQEVRVTASSGNHVLDDEARDAVRRAPMPPFPKHWTLEQLELVAQFDYRLDYKAE